MDRFKDKVAGLPVWAWALVLGLVMVAVMYWMRARQAAGTATDAAPVYDALDTEGSLGTATGTDAPAPVDPEIVYGSNRTWEAQAISIITALGVSPLKAQRAVEAYLNGDPLNWEQAIWINTAIAAKGLPPEGTNGVSPETPKPQPKPTPKPSPNPGPTKPKPPAPNKSKRVPKTGHGHSVAGRQAFLANHHDLASRIGHPTELARFLRDHPGIAKEWMKVR